MKSTYPPDSTHPLLLDYSVVRTESEELPGQYDDERDVWMIQSPKGTRPLVEDVDGLAECETKTFAEIERDRPESDTVLETLTKTEHTRERDETPVSCYPLLLSVLTKTKVQAERDD